jgi:hypothetical protein
LRGKIIVFARERATAAEGGTHVYLNSKMMQEFTLLLLKSESPALSGDDRPRGREDLSSFLTRPVVTDASFHQGLALLQAFKLNGS